MRQRLYNATIKTDLGEHVRRNLLKVELITLLEMYFERPEVTEVEVTISDLTESTNYQKRYYHRIGGNAMKPKPQGTVLVEYDDMQRMFDNEAKALTYAKSESNKCKYVTVSVNGVAIAKWIDGIRQE